MSVNKIILLGFLGKDPIIKKLDSGKSVAQFTLATSESYKDRSGQKVTNTEWHNVVAWSPLAEIAEKYLKKGSQVYVEGKLTSREYTDKEGATKRITEIVVRELTLIGGGDKPDSKEREITKEEVSHIDDNSDDLPF